MCVFVCVCKNHPARFWPMLPSRSGSDANRMRHVYWGSRTLHSASARFVRSTVRVFVSYTPQCECSFRTCSFRTLHSASARFVHSTMRVLVSYAPQRIRGHAPVHLKLKKKREKKTHSGVLWTQNLRSPPL